MSIAAHEVFYYHDCPVFYVQNDYVYWLANRGLQKDFSLEDKVKLKDFLVAHGVEVSEINRQGVLPEVKQLSERWVKRVESQRKILRQLNRLASNADNPSLSVEMNEDDYTSNELAILLDELEDLGCLQVDKKKIKFKHQAARFFANGGWLEEYIYSVAQALKKECPQIQEVAKSINVNWKDGSKTKNELDVVILANNRLHIIECKTQATRKGDDNMMDALYKLSGNKDRMGGSASRGMLVSYHAIRDEDKERASLMKLKLCDANGLKSIKGKIKEMING